MGSEMCIRDRLRRIPATPSRAQSASAAHTLDGALSFPFYFFRWPGCADSLASNFRNADSTISTTETNAATKNAT